MLLSQSTILAISFILNCLVLSDFYTLLKEVRRGHCCIHKELLVLLDLEYSLVVRIHCERIISILGPQIRVPRAVFNGMTQLLATHAPDIVQLVLVLLLLNVVLILVLLALVRPNLAPRLVLPLLAAAPPNVVLVVVEGLVRAAHPLEVLLLCVLLGALLALLDADIHPPFSVLYPLNLQLLPLVFLQQVVVLLFDGHVLVDLFFEVTIDFVEFGLQFRHLVLVAHGLDEGLVLDFLLGVGQDLAIYCKLVLLLENVAAILLNLNLFAPQVVDKLLQSRNFEPVFIFQILGIRDGIDALVEHVQLLVNYFVANRVQLLVLSEFKQLVVQVVLLLESCSQLFRKLLAIVL